MPFDAGASDDKILRVLRGAIDSLDRQGWCRNKLVADRDNAQSSMCIMGHIQHGAGHITWNAQLGHWARQYAESYEGHDTIGQVIDYIVQAFSPELGMNKVSLIPIFNDEICEGPEQARQVLENAIQRRIEELTTA